MGSLPDSPATPATTSCASPISLTYTPAACFNSTPKGDVSLELDKEKADELLPNSEYDEGDISLELGEEGADELLQASAEEQAILQQSDDVFRQGIPNLAGSIQQPSWVTRETRVFATTEAFQRLSRAEKVDWLYTELLPNPANRVKRMLASPHPASALHSH